MQALSVCSYLKACEPGSDDDFLESLGDHLRLAQDIGAWFVRVFPGANGAGTEGDERAVRRLSSAMPDATESGVRILLETHDSHPRGADIAAILGELDARCPGHTVGAIWDVLHPWRAGETPETTLRSIAPWLEYVQIKDAEVTGELRVVGDGAVPLDEIAALLRNRPDLWWSLEWERLWDPRLAALPIALGAARSWYDNRVESEKGGRGD